MLSCKISTRGFSFETVPAYKVLTLHTIMGVIMSAIDKAIEEVRFAIPYEILKEAFKVDAVYTSNRTTTIRTSMESRIREEVIDRKVLVDCNLVGGTEVLVPLGGLSQKTVDASRFVVNVPLDRTDGQHISSVLSVMEAPFGYADGQLGCFSASNSHDRLSNNMFDAVTGNSGNHSIEGRGRVIGPNSIFLTVPAGTYGELLLRCRVNSDSNMSTLPPTAWLDFSKLVILGVKAYIYRELAIRMDEGQLSGGLNLGKFKEIVDEYSDAHVMYNEFLEEKWIRIAAINDEVRHGRAILHQFGRFRM